MKIAFFDTESTDLKAMMGRLLCATVKTIDGSMVTYRIDEAPHKGRSAIDDSKLCVALRDTLEEANLIVGWNSKLHDIPLLNARLAKAGHRPFQPQMHLDLMWYAGGSSMKIGSRKLDNVAKYFELPSQKTPISWDMWQRAASGDKEAMDIVVEHCECDVDVLEEAYWHLIPYVKNLHR